MATAPDLPKALHQAARRLSDLSGTLAALESGLFQDAEALDGLRDYCAGLRLVKDSIREIKDDLDSLSAVLAA